MIEEEEEEEEEDAVSIPPTSQDHTEGSQRSPDCSAYSCILFFETSSGVALAHR
jgi:hypothetical protein